MRVAVVAIAVCCSIIGLAAADDVKAAIRKPTNIAAQHLGPALKELAAGRGLQVLYFSDIVRDLQTQGASGEMTVSEALDQLLAGTGLTYRFLDEKTVTVFPIAAESEATSSSLASPTTQVDAGGNSINLPAEQDTQKAKGSFWDRFRLAQADQSIPSSASSVTATQGPAIPENSGLQEVVVTAQKRQERLQDVPIPVSTVNAELLVESNQQRIEDYYTQIPGLSMEATVESAQILSIRGITTGGSDAGAIPTVGVTVDDIPYGSSVLSMVPDIDPGDLARLEVLRGPQGTLYGASSMGGLIKYVTVDPTTSGFSGRLEAGTSSVYNGAELGYTLRGSANVPVTDNFAIRISAFTRLDPGYIDNPVLGIDGIDKAHANGGHLAALWKPTDSLSIKLSALVQEISGDGTNDVTKLPGFGDWQQSYVRGVGPYVRKAQQYGLVINDKFAGVDLTSVTGYGINAVHDSLDISGALGGAVSEKLFGPGATAVPNYDSFRTTKFSQEVRLSGQLLQKLDWQLGGFYTYENNSPFFQYLPVENGNTGAVVGQLVYLNFPSTYTEYAGFADLTYHFTDRFDLQVGARESEIRQNIKPATYIGVYDTAFLGQSSEYYVYPQKIAKSSPFTYLFTPRYKLTPDLMVYVRLASGYRPGGANSAQPGTPPEYSPDKVYNYELGVKADFLDHTLSLDASAYYIDWKDIQLTLNNTVTHQTFIGNAGAAKSQGGELTLESRPISGLRLAAWIAYDDAELTSFPAEALLAGTYAVPGDRLPQSPQFSGNIAVDEDFPLAANTHGFVGLSSSYIGGRYGLLTASSTREYLPAYVRTDVRGGVRYDTWTANLYINNVGNTRGLISGGLGNIIPYSYYYIQPRTIGVNIAKTF